MTARVTTVETAAEGARDGAREWLLVPPLRGSELALSAVALDARSRFVVGDDLHDKLVFVHREGGSLAEEDDTELGVGATVLVRQGERSTLVAGADGLEGVVGTIGAAVDLHAPMGAARRIARLDQAEAGKATGARSFQVLFDATNGSTRAALFVGHIPPGRAPWHYHLYDEIVWVLAGEGLLHIDASVEALGPGSAFRLRPREPHIVENTSLDRPLSVLGLFTPAGSPSAAYLEPGIFATYAAQGG